MKKAVAILSITLILLFSASWCFGETQNGVLHINKAEVQQKEINIYYHVTDLDGKIIENIGKDKLEAKLGDKKLNILSTDVFQNTGKSTAYVFLVDVSKSITASQWQQVRQILGDMTNSPGKDDSYAIVTFGEKVNVAQDFTSDKQKIKAIVKGLQNKDSKTNLYRGIVKSLEMLSSTKSSMLQSRTLVIISDGAEDDNSGITKDEAFMKIKEAHIPVFTIGMYNKTSGKTGIDSIKTLGSFSRITSGEDYVLGMENETIPGIIQSLQQRLGKSYVAKLDCTGISMNGQSSYLKLAVDLGGENKAEDGINIDLSPENTPPSTSGTNTNPNSPSTSTTTSGGTKISGEPVEVDDSKSITDYLMSPYVIAAGALVVIAFAGILLFATGRKKKAPAQSAPINNAPRQNVNNEPRTMNMDSQKKGSPAGSPAAAVASPEVSARKGLAVRLTKLGRNSEDAYTVNLADSVTIGRDPNRSKLVFKDDEKLSGKHCELMLKDNMVFVCDLKSTNGTYVNGVQINHYHRLRNDDILLIGSMELRVNFNDGT